MKLKFSVNYHTQWGENLVVVIQYHHSDHRITTHQLVMQTDDGEYWTCETAVMESRQRHVKSFCYHYQLQNAQGEVLRKEWTLVPRLFAFDHSKSYIFPDMWRDIPLHHHLYTRAWHTAHLLPMPVKVQPVQLPLFRKTVIFRVSAPQLQKGQLLAVCGNHPSLGNWNPVRFLPMTHIGEADWMLSVNAEAMPLPLEYKYVVIDEHTKTLLQWEEGDNRTSGGNELTDGQVLVLNGDSLRLREDTWKAAGVAVPLFSLRSEHSCGVGDFGDLQRMVDWAVETGMKIIQLLPVNDTTSTRTWTDSHPYNAISAFALHPHYLDLEQLPELRDAQKRRDYQRQRRELNSFAYSDYEAVERVKQAYIDDIFAQCGEVTLKSDDFAAFYVSNKWWLDDYAAFCILRDRYHTANYSEWEILSVFDRESASQLCVDNEETRKIFFVQYHLWRQFRNAAEYARGRGVVIKGDLAIGFARFSVETWSHPQYFNTDSQAGTPPDREMPYGQNWGFPTYCFPDVSPNNLQSPATDNQPSLIVWLQKRLTWMEQFFDAFRIDHVVGYFRMWDVPIHCVHATMGHYNPALPFTEAEIGQFGLSFRKELMTRPFANDRVLERLFGLHASFVRDNFLHRKAYGLYDVLPEFDTQAKVREYFLGKTDENSLWIRDGLYRLVQDVLFIEDKLQPSMYHPRFGAINEPVYDILSADEKDAYMRLYNNYFYERHNQYWAFLASRRLAELLSETHMLVCGEDLGLLPPCVEPVLDALRILSLEVQDMPKDYADEFAHIDAYPYRSVATFSTHDMPTMRQWWEQNPGRTQRYFTTMLQKQGRAPKTLSSVLAEEIVARHLYGPSMLCVMMLQDWLATDATLRETDAADERINTPFDSFNQWRYRMPVTIETLIKSTAFNRKLNTMLTRSRRC